MDAESILIYLAACVVNQTKPDKKLLEKLKSEEDLINKLYLMAKQHHMSALVAAALLKSELQSNVLMQERAEAIWRERLFDHDRKAIINKLEEAEIWYLPLKGVILKDYYPQIGIRQMSDNDILFDSGRAEDVKHIMTELGFSNTSYGTGHRDDYVKLPVSHFEMHRMLFDAQNYHKVLHLYYLNVKEKLIKDEDNGSGYHFSREDFYIYMIAHEYSHYIFGGTGLRSLLDTYVFLQRDSEILDWNYISTELDKLELKAFEKQNRILAQKLFSLQQQDSQHVFLVDTGGAGSHLSVKGSSGSDLYLTQEEQSLLNYHISSGAYGSWEHSIENRLKKKGLGKYLISRIFLPMSQVKEQYPLFYKYKWLSLFLPLYRLVVQRKRAIIEISVLFHSIRLKRK